MSVEIRQHQPGRDLEDFIQVAFDVYADDPAWVAPLNMEITDRLTPEKNPFFEHAEVALSTSWSFTVSKKPKKPALYPWIRKCS